VLLGKIRIGSDGWHIVGACRCVTPPAFGAISDHVATTSTAREKLMGDIDGGPPYHRFRLQQAIRSPTTFYGALLIVIAVALFAVGVTGFSHHHVDGAIASIVTAVATGAVGVVWLTRRARLSRGPREDPDG
jgi:hypothetical protein